MSAVDDDLEGTIVYTLEGEFPVQSFIDLDQFSGVVTLRNSLLSDSTQNTIYTVRIVTSYFDMLLRMNMAFIQTIYYQFHIKYGLKVILCWLKTLCSKKL